MALRVWRGNPYPLGATWDGSGVNFAIFSEHAEDVDLCLFDADGAEQPLVLGEGCLDLSVLWQHGEVGDAEALGRLALGDAIVVVPVLDHEPRRLARDGLAHHVAADGSPGHQKIGSS